MNKLQGVRERGRGFITSRQESHVHNTTPPLFSNIINISKLGIPHIDSNGDFYFGRRLSSHSVNYITEALNDGMYCLGVFLDLRKAFDVCSHEILLKKLKKMGIQETTHKWFESYLSNRTQCVDIAGNLSEQIAYDI
jgi:hypothetical protein